MHNAHPQLYDYVSFKTQLHTHTHTHRITHIHIILCTHTVKSAVQTYNKLIDRINNVNI